MYLVLLRPLPYEFRIEMEIYCYATKMVSISVLILEFSDKCYRRIFQFSIISNWKELLALSRWILVSINRQISHWSKACYILLWELATIKTSYGIKEVAQAAWRESIIGKCVYFLYLNLKCN